MKIKQKIQIILTLVVLMTACAKQVKPDLARLYLSSSKQTSTRPPVILIHGIMGSKLRDKTSLKELWYGSLKHLAFSNYANLGLEIDPITLEPINNNIESFAIVDKAAGVDYYNAIITTLQEYGRYQLTQVDEKITDKVARLYVFTYDWREDNVKSAKKLSEFIDKIKNNYKDENLKFDLVAHSMGGLISRYYLRYGNKDVLNSNDFPINLEGAQNIRKIVLLGTPNFGSVDAVEAFITGMQIGLRKIPTEVLVTMPSVYQLFPHSINNWLVDREGRALDRDVFNEGLWKSFEWSIYDPKVQKRILKRYDNPQQGQEHIETLKRYFHKNLERARRFLWSLSVPIENPPYKIIVMGGDCNLTPAKLLVEEVEGVSMLRLRPANILNPLAEIDYQMIMLEPGDGTVTKSSLLARATLDPTIARHKYSFFPLDYPYFLCEKHETLTTNVNFEDNLLHILLSR